MLATRLIGNNEWIAPLCPPLATEATEDSGEPCGDVSGSNCGGGGAAAAAVPRRLWGVGPRCTAGLGPLGVLVRAVSDRGG